MIKLRQSQGFCEKSGYSGDRNEDFSAESVVER